MCVALYCVILYSLWLLLHCCFCCIITGILIETIVAARVCCCVWLLLFQVSIPLVAFVDLWLLRVVAGL